MRPLLTVAALLLIIAAPLAAEPSPWFSEVGWSAEKTFDSLESIGAGPSISVYKWADQHAIWLDVALLYDGAADTMGGFAGVSTEIEGQAILEALTAPVRLLSKDLLSNAGLGLVYSNGGLTATAYVTTRF